MSIALGNRATSGSARAALRPCAAPSGAVFRMPRSAAAVASGPLSHQRDVRGGRVVAAATDGGPETKTNAPKPSPQDEPIWVRREREREAAKKDQGVPWALYLVASVLIAIAAVGCIFEYTDRNAFFGLIQPDSPLWAPVLITLAVTGFPSAGYMFYRGVTKFNEDMERQDRMDGYMD
mmetsp:Transcript_18932/g.56412  ORF Transcript_18932/g.56412 Transcript_18932/m.56412 type:complete len:178 (+) Transcript_18932:75-608(+)